MKDILFDNPSSHIDTLWQTKNIINRIDNLARHT